MTSFMFLFFVNVKVDVLVCVVVQPENAQVEGIISSPGQFRSSMKARVELKIVGHENWSNY